MKNLIKHLNTSKTIFSRHQFSHLFITAIVGSYFILVLQFILLSRVNKLNPNWQNQIVILFIILAVVIAILLKMNDEIIKLLIIIVSTVISIIMTLPLSSYLSIKGNFVFLILFLSLVMSCYKLVLLPVLIYLGALVFFHGVQLEWTMDTSQTGCEEFLFLFMIVIAFFVLNLKVREKMSSEEQKNNIIKRLRNTVEELSAANVGYSTFTQLSRHQAASEERNRITREIHDGIGYTLTSIIMLSEVASDKVFNAPEEVSKALNSIKIQSKTGLYDTRRALRMLRTAEEGLPKGMAAIKKMVTVFQNATSINVKIEVYAKIGVIEHSSHFLTIYRFIQEGLTNAFRHGNANEVIIRFQQNEGWLHVIVKDDGRGTKMIQEGIGLQGMRERIEELGGDLSYSSSTGFSVNVSIPTKEDINR